MPRPHHSDHDAREQRRLDRIAQSSQAKTQPAVPAAGTVWEHKRLGIVRVLQADEFELVLETVVLDAEPEHVLVSEWWESGPPLQTWVPVPVVKQRWAWGKHYGTGVVLEVASSYVVVDFEVVGLKRISPLAFAKGVVLA